MKQMKGSHGCSFLGRNGNASSCLFLLFLPWITQAIFPEEAGQLDFLVATTGHGPVGLAFVVNVDKDESSAIVTSDISGSSCYVASRNVTDGNLLWRRNVCSETNISNNKNNNKKRTHTVTANEEYLFTANGAGIVQAWDIHSGALVWDAPVAVGDDLPPRMDIDDNNKKLFVRDVVLSASTGEKLATEKGNQAKPSSRGILSLEVSCSLLDVTLALDGSRQQLTTKGKNAGEFKSDFHLKSSYDKIRGMTLLSCSNSGMSILIASERGTTAKLDVTAVKENQWHAVVAWSAEEGLAHLQAGVLLDAGHYVGDLTEEKGHHLLAYTARLQSQWKGLLDVLGGAFQQEGIPRRDYLFGFVKIAVLLSSETHRLFGLNTNGSHRKQIRYTVDLPENAKWHRLVHGAPNAKTVSHGIHGGTHARELLILSMLENKNEMHYTCVDGTSGARHGEGTVAVTSPVRQVLPISLSGTSRSGCRQQGALLLLQDRSIVTIPPVVDNDASHLTALVSRMEQTGLYGHWFDAHPASIETFSITSTPTSKQFQARTIGYTAFPGERILATAYPSRDEVIQSPVHIQGDDSLLLKYMNPHMAVIVTMSEQVEKDPFSQVLKPIKKGPGHKSTTTTTTQKRKPAGATPISTSDDPNAAAALAGVTHEPNLFVNVIDTVSGRVLYRASHTNAMDHPAPSVILSENWIYYTFMNERTRRAEIGVLSLFEGMVDSKGLTAFTKPEQTTHFSSLDARESKPVVLAKTYSLPKAPLALGITNTRGGISGRRLLVAGNDGSIFGIDRKVLEPRRPLGQLKESEKKEGLVQYSELIPTVSYMSLSYSQNVEAVKHIVTAPTDLESQALVLAFGGPDIFFTRTSPSKGFDLLPDSFNRILLSIVVVALLVTSFVVKQMANKRVRKEGWI